MQLGDTTRRMKQIGGKTSVSVRDVGMPYIEQEGSQTAKTDRAEYTVRRQDVVYYTVGRRDKVDEAYGRTGKCRCQGCLE